MDITKLKRTEMVWQKKQQRDRLMGNSLQGRIVELVLSTIVIGFLYEWMLPQAVDISSDFLSHIVCSAGILLDAQNLLRLLL